jgi:beta-D-xylosidase 4
VTTDCDGYPQSYQFHNYSGSPEEGVRDMMRAGLDVDCAFGSGITLDIATVHSALRLGTITLADVDTALRHLFTVRMKLGHFDAPGPLQQIPETVICSAEHKAVARAGASQSAVLLKNLDRTLPLSSSSVGRVAVVGPNGDLSKAIAGYYGAGKVCDGQYYTMVDAIKQYAEKTTFLKGVTGVGDRGGRVTAEDIAGIANATALAKVSDVTVLVVGTDLSTAHEGHDAVNISLSVNQQQLVASVASAAAKPVIVVVMSAVPLDLSALMSNPKVGAILWVGQPSVQCLGVGDVLFGKVAAAGRMVQTLYPVSFQHELSIFDMNMRPGPSKFPRPDGRGCKPGTAVVPCSSGTSVGKCTPDVDCVMGTNPGRTHRFFNRTAVVPFGWGLAYTTFKYHTSVT